MDLKKRGKSGKLGRAEAIGALVVICAYMFTMLASYSQDPQLFQTQLLYFSILTFCLVAMILAFDKLTLECCRISKYVVLGCVISLFAMFALVNWIVVSPSILALAAFSSVTPTVGLAVYQLIFVGASEGILHWACIRLSYAATKNWGIAIILGSAILGAMHIYAVGAVPLTLIFLALIFCVIAGLSMTPLLLGGKTKFSLLISASVHACYNLALLSMSGAVVA